MTLWTRRIFKKVPLPWAFCLIKTEFFDPSWDMAQVATKLDQIIRRRFCGMYGERVSISTKERKDWAQFLSDRGICWDVSTKNEPKWEGWETRYSDGHYISRPRGLEGHIRVNYYYVPKELAMKMLTLNDLF